MAFDQNSLQKDLSSLNVAGKPGIVTEEPQIADAVAATSNARGRYIEGFCPNPSREPGTRGSMPVLYPEMVNDAGFVSLGYGKAVPSAPGVPAWRPQMPVPVLVGGFDYNLNSSNMVVGNAMDQVSHGYSPSLGNRKSGNGSDQLCNDRVHIGFAHSSNLGNRGSGTMCDQSSNDVKPNLGLGSNVSGADQVSDDGGDDSVSRKKVKLLCSFGGKILPRPGDGMLRYVGGQTRIISVRRDVSFDEFERKLVDAYGQSVVIKYQLPDEDLDAWVFLFSASELEPSCMVQFGDLHGNVQKYVEAVNGIVDGAAGGITRKVSVASAGSTQNSDISGLEAVDIIGSGQGDVGGSPTTKMSSPRGNSGSHVVKSGPPQTFLSQLEVEAGRTVPLTLTPQQMEYDLRQHYASTYIDPRHDEFLDNAAPHQYIPAYNISMTPFNSHVGIRPAMIQPLMQQQQTPLERYSDENAFGTRVIQHPADLRHSVYQTQVPSAMVATDSMGTSLVNNVLVTGSNGIAEQQAGIRYIGHVDNQFGGLQSAAAGSSQDLDAQTGDEINISPRIDNSNHCRIPASQDLMDLAGELQSPYVLPTQHQFQKEVPNSGAVGIQASEQPVHEASNVQAVPKEDCIDPNHLIQIDIYGKEVLLDNIFSQRIDSNEVVTLGNLALHGYPPVQAQTLDFVQVRYGNPLFSGVDSAHTLGLDDVSWMQQKTAQSNTEAAPSNANRQTYFSPSGGDVLDSSNSLFSNQDPWTLHQGTYFPPPIPNKIQTNREGLATRDPFGENQTVIGGESNIESADEVHQPSSSTEDLVKKELQAVAEGVAASVFQSSLHSDSDIPTETNASGYEGNQDTDVLPNDIKMQHKAKFEEIKTKQPDRMNFGFRISDGIGRLQIIKDSDLEELWEIGSGTFGTVYHGKWRGTDVAIKRINDRCFAGKPSEQERMIDDFWNEAIKLADLHHPNVVAFYGVVLDGPGGSVATVTEYMVNGSLRNALQKTERNLDKRKRLLVAMDVAFGMEYLHGKNIVHFDLKSDNLLVNLRDPHRPICKVGDLGLSKVKCQTLISGGVRGTLPWMAPELLNGSSSLVSEKVDVFSFGIVMWELLTREEPYADLHYGTIIGGIVSNTLRPPVPESCDPEWRSLMERCWSAEPSERPNFIELVNELRLMATRISPKGQNPQ
ncbi:Kinase superfamily protein with octicosapeptide/Phox/Bem1p domain [Hibiscus syriacus]|uniref:Kinase superfamily protein with octicosapeptide/Phox/Bem1p domain n=1 Tax=Hibiscus syriacus TaxID=106335 RepID=A0A6A3CCB8_HIBSY|nr:Kinase superfamily protein with octicosapeptide/Phox/Bem1p domain [Hibiscus syriacus]